MLRQLDKSRRDRSDRAAPVQGYNGGPPVDEAITISGALLPSNSNWTHVVFPIPAADLLTLLSGSATTFLNQDVAVDHPQPDTGRGSASWRPRGGQHQRWSDCDPRALKSRSHHVGGFEGAYGL
jgi:hypothetical protein